MARPLGGKKFGGRQKGTPNKIPASLKDLCRTYTAEAVRAIAHLMRVAPESATRLAAAQHLLDRGWGRALTPVAVAELNPSDLMSDAELNASIRQMYAELCAPPPPVPLPLPLRELRGIAESTSAIIDGQVIDIAVDR